MAQFGDILAALRKTHQITQKDLATVIHVSVSTISNYENGIHLPDMDQLSELADFFHVTTDYLLGRTSANLPIETVNQIVFDGKTAGEIIQELQAMTPERKRALALIIDDMKFSMMVNEYNKKKEEVPP